MDTLAGRDVEDRQGLTLGCENQGFGVLGRDVRWKKVVRVKIDYQFKYLI
jgi:hypothetical protein